MSENHTGIFWTPLRLIKKMIEPRVLLTFDEFAEHSVDAHQLGILQEKSRCLNIMFETIDKLYDCDSIDSNERIWFDANQLLDILEQAHREIAEGEK